MVGAVRRFRSGIDALEITFDLRDMHAVQTEVLLDLQIEFHFKMLYIRDFRQSENPVSLQICNGGKWNSCVGQHFCDGAIFRCLITMTIYNDHLSIHIFEGPKSGITMGQQLVRTHHRAGISKGQRL